MIQELFETHLRSRPFSISALFNHAHVRSDGLVCDLPPINLVCELPTPWNPALRLGHFGAETKKQRSTFCSVELAVRKVTFLYQFM